MRFHYLSLTECPDAIGTVVVIDVLRAFSTAAFAFDVGAETIAVVGTIEEAFEVKRSDPDLILLGEKGGWPVGGFDYGNAPSEVIGADLRGRRVVMRTSAGTQGVVRAEHAEDLLAANLVCARATAEYIRQQDPHDVSFIITGANQGGFGDEDQACADYIVNLLVGRRSDRELLKSWVLNSGWGRRFRNLEYPFLDPADKDYCTAIDRFDFFMLYETHSTGRHFQAHQVI